MKSQVATFRVRSSVSDAAIGLTLACLVTLLGSLYPGGPAVADGKHSFVTLPGDAARYSGEIGGEANIAEILATGVQTGGIWGVWRYTSVPNSGPPLHIHREEDEFFYVLSGEFAIQLGDCIRVAPAGSYIFIPKGAVHTFKNMNAGPGELLGVVSPAGFEGFFKDLQGATPEVVEELLKKHAMDAVGPPIDLSALEPFRDTQSVPPPKAHRIGVLSPGCSPPSTLLRTLFDGLGELGYTDGQDIWFEWRYSEGDAERFADLANELVQLDVDVIVAMSTPAALAAKRATGSIPIVMVYVADPEGSGLVASLAQPGGNITGVTDMATELSAKRLALLNEVVPALSRVAVIWNSADPGMVLRFKEIQAAARTLGVAIQSVEIRRPSDVELAFAAIMQEPPDGLFLIAEALTISQRCRILAFAEKNMLPAMYEFGLFARDGGLMAYGPKLTESFERGAHFVDKILKGVKPANIPVEQPMSFELLVNRDAAESLGLTIPPLILAQADVVKVEELGRCARMW